MNRENETIRVSSGDCEVLTINEFAKELKVCTKTVYRLIDAGEIPRPAKVGKCSRFSRRAVDEYKRKIGLLPPIM
jgi:excisionase family DNA binding protein